MKIREWRGEEGRKEKREESRTRGEGRRGRGDGDERRRKEGRRYAPLKRADEISA